MINIILYGFSIGVVATGIMSIENVFAWKIWGLKGVLEWHESQSMVNKVLSNSNQDVLRLNGLIIHFFNGGLLAIPFTLLVTYFPVLITSILYSVLYALLVWFITLAPIHKFLTGDSLLNHPLGKLPIFFSIIGHILYGLTLGALLSIEIFN